MDRELIERLSRIEVEIRTLREKLEQLEEEKEAIQERELDEVLSDLDLTEVHLDRLKDDLSAMWRDLGRWVRERFGS